MSRIRHRLAGAAGLGALVVAACQSAPRHATVVDPPEPLPALAFPGAPDPVPLADGRRWTLLSVGYTRCPDICPLTLAHLAAAWRALGQDTTRLRVLFVSLDEADDPAAAARFAARFHPAFRGVVAPPPARARLARALGLAAFPGAGGGLHHTARIWAVDPAGRLRALWPPDLPGDTLAAEVRRIW